MKLTPIGPKEGQSCMMCEGPMGPPELDICGDDFEALGMQQYRVGDMLMMSAQVRVSSMSDRGEPRVCLEVKAAAFELATPPIAPEKILFPGDGQGMD